MHFRDEPLPWYYPLTNKKGPKTEYTTYQVL